MPEPITVEAVVSTGAPVLRPGPRPDGTWGPWLERLDIPGADLDRLPGGPLLLDHLPRSDFVVGVVEGARREGQSIVATLRFGEGRQAQEIARDVKARIRRQLSTGYSVEEWRREGGKNDPAPTFTATKWQPLEVSVVAIGADPGARFRSSTPDPMRYRTMPLEPSPAAPEAAPAVPAAPAAAAPDPVALERERVRRIYRMAEYYRLDRAHADRLVSDGVPLDQARDELDNLLAAQTPIIRNINPMAHGGVDHRDPAMIRSRMAAALGHKLSGGLSPLPEASREFVGCSPLDMGRILLEARGFRIRSQAEAVDALLGRTALSTRLGGLHTTSDFSWLLVDAANQAVQARFQHLPPALLPLARRSLSQDMRPIYRHRLGEGSPLAEVNEHGEVTRGTFGESRESYAVKTYARIFGVTRHLLVNDPTGALMDHLASQVQSASRLLGDLLAGVLLDNPVMSDGTALWHANHGNTGSAAAISVASLTVARQAMRSQKGIDGGPIQVAPRFLVVGAAKETEAEQVLTTLAAAQTSNANPFAGKLELIVEPRITGNKWFLFSDPAVAPVIEYAELDGSRPMSGTGPIVETRVGFDVDGLELKVTYDVGAGAVGWVGGYYNPGA